jgi:peroxiredoxin family protein
VAGKEKKPATSHLLRKGNPMFNETESNRKLCIICSKGSLDMAYPGLVLGNAALSEGVDVMMFFTFWGLDIINKRKMNHLNFSLVGNTSMPVPTMVGGLPGMSGLATTMMKREITKLEIPPVDEFLEMITDAGGRMYACKMTVDMFEDMHLMTESDLYEGIEGVVSASDFIEMTEGAQMLFI